MKLNQFTEEKGEHFGDLLLMKATKSEGDDFLKNKPVPKSGAFCFICVVGRPNAEVMSKSEK